MITLKQALIDLVSTQPQIKAHMAGLVCPDCSEGPDKCQCNNGVPISEDDKNKD